MISLYLLAFYRITAKFHRFTNAFFLNAHDIKPSNALTVETVLIPKYRERLMKLQQFDYYKERRDDTFDFAILGESENIPIF